MSASGHRREDGDFVAVLERASRRRPCPGSPPRGMPAPVRVQLPRRRRADAARQPARPHRCTSAGRSICSEDMPSASRRRAKYSRVSMIQPSNSLKGVNLTASPRATVVPSRISARPSPHTAEVSTPEPWLGIDGHTQGAVRLRLQPGTHEFAPVAGFAPVEGCRQQVAARRHVLHALAAQDEGPHEQAEGGESRDRVARQADERRLSCTVP